MNWIQRWQQRRELLKRGGQFRLCPWCDKLTIVLPVAFSYNACLFCGRQVERFDEPWTSYIEFEDGCTVQANPDGTVVMRRIPGEPHSHEGIDSHEWKRLATGRPIAVESGR